MTNGIFKHQNQYKKMRPVKFSVTLKYIWIAKSQSEDFALINMKKITYQVERVDSVNPKVKIKESEKKKDKHQDLAK